MHKMRDHIPPEIKRCRLENLILTGKMIFPHLTPSQFVADALTPPTDADVGQSVKILKDMGALSLLKNDGDKGIERIGYKPVTLADSDLVDGAITALGRIIVNLPIEPSMSRLIYYGINFGLVQCSKNKCEKKFLFF